MINGTLCTVICDIIANFAVGWSVNNIKEQIVIRSLPEFVVLGMSLLLIFFLGLDRTGWTPASSKKSCPNSLLATLLKSWLC